MTALLSVLSTACLFAIMGCIATCLYRLVRGPHVVDRILAFDLIAVLVAAALAIHAVRTGSWLYIEIAMGLAVLGLVATVAVAHFVRGEGVF
jgi:multicomponent Na+:H+ antiporter subunit F